MNLDKTILFLVTREVVPDGYYVWLAESLGKYMKVFVMSDFDKPYTFNNATYLHMSDEECLAANYKYCVFNEYDIAGDKCKRVVTAWDKMLLYLNTQQIDFDYDYVWICEDDVYMHSEEHALKLFERYNNVSADYIAKDFFNYAMNPGWCQWYTCDKIFDKQHLHGAFTPLCRLSKKLVNSCDLLVKEKGCLALIEGLFICLCAKYNLSAYSGWLQYQPIRTCPDVSKEEIMHVLKNAPYTIFHPVELSDEEKFALMKEVTVNI